MTSGRDVQLKLAARARLLTPNSARQALIPVVARLYALQLEELDHV